MKIVIEFAEYKELLPFYNEGIWKAEFEIQHNLDHIDNLRVTFDPTPLEKAKVVIITMPFGRREEFASKWYKVNDNEYWGDFMGAIVAMSHKACKSLGIKNEGKTSYNKIMPALSKILESRIRTTLFPTIFEKEKKELIASLEITDKNWSRDYKVLNIDCKLCDTYKLKFETYFENKTAVVHIGFKLITPDDRIVKVFCPFGTNLTAMISELAEGLSRLNEFNSTPYEVKNQIAKNYFNMIKEVAEEEASKDLTVKYITYQMANLKVVTSWTEGEAKTLIKKYEKSNQLFGIGNYIFKYFHPIIEITSMLNDSFHMVLDAKSIRNWHGLSTVVLRNLTLDSNFQIDKDWINETTKVLDGMYGNQVLPKDVSEVLSALGATGDQVNIIAGALKKARES